MPLVLLLRHPTPKPLMSPGPLDSTQVTSPRSGSSQSQCPPSFLLPLTSPPCFLLPGIQQSRACMMSPPPGSDPSARHIGLRGAEGYQVNPHSSSSIGAVVSELCARGDELVHAGLFKAPMPPHHQSQLETCGTTGGRRDMGFALCHSQDPSLPSTPLSGLGSPHRSPYSQTPGTPRPDYSQQMTEPFTQQSPLTSLPSPDSYASPQTPGTPHPHSEPYLTTPPALRLDQYNQKSTSRRPSPSHQNVDTYASNPGTPRPSITEHFPRSPGSQRSSDPYTLPDATSQPLLDPYIQQPSALRPQKGPEPFSQALKEILPQLTGSGSSPLVQGLSGETVTFSPTHLQVTDDTVHHTCVLECTCKC